MDVKISVIIPIFNVEPFLRECLESVRYNFSDFGINEAEAILVDDGSTDSSGRIALEFCRENRGFRYYNQINKGLSEARNTGLKHATGKYIFFLDSDDMLEIGILKKLYTYAQQNNCGITQCGINYYYGDTRDYVSSDTNEFPKDIVISRKEAISLLVENIKIKNFACGKLYESGLIKSMRFRPGKYFEDSYWQYKVICSDVYDNYGIIPVAGYKYRQRELSITGTFSNRYIDLLEGGLEMCQYMEKCQPEFVQRCTYRLWKNLIWFDSQLKQHVLAFNDIDAKRIATIRDSFNTFSQYLKKCTEYKIWKLSPSVYQVYSKFVSVSNRVKEKLHLS